MTAILNWIKALEALALVAVTVLCLTLTYEIAHVGQHISNALMAVTDVAASATTITAKLNNTLDSVNRTVVLLNQPKTGSIALLNDDLRNLRIAAINVNQAAIQERVFLEQTQPEEVAKLNDVLDASRESIVALQPVLQSVNDEAKELNTATASINALATNPHLVSAIANVDSTTAHVNATSKDVQQVVHGYLHPTWAHKIYGWALDIAHALNPL
jgi:hypothetical protein